MLPVEIVLPATFAKLDLLSNSLLFQIIVLTKSGDIVLKGLIVLLGLLTLLLVHRVHLEQQQLYKRQINALLAPKVITVLTQA